MFEKSEGTDVTLAIQILRPIIITQLDTGWGLILGHETNTG